MESEIRDLIRYFNLEFDLLTTMLTGNNYFISSKSVLIFYPNEFDYDFYFKNKSLIESKV